MNKPNESTTQETQELKWSQADADGFYWWRYDRNGIPEPVEVRDGMFYSVADTEPTSVSVGEFLGPIVPSDTGEITRLRAALESVRKNHKPSNNQDYEYGYYDALDQLSAALRPEPEQEQEK